MHLNFAVSVVCGDKLGSLLILFNLCLTILASEYKANSGKYLDLS